MLDDVGVVGRSDPVGKAGRVERGAEDVVLVEGRHVLEVRVGVEGAAAQPRPRADDEPNDVLCDAVLRHEFPGPFFSP